MDAEQLLRSRVLLSLREFAEITGQSAEGVRNRADEGKLGMPVVYAAIEEKMSGAPDADSKPCRRRRYVRVSDVRRMLDPITNVASH